MGSDRTISQSELSDWRFSAHDAVFLTDEAQLAFLNKDTNTTFHSCRLLPVSIQALAAAIRSGNSRLEPYFLHIDFVECRRGYEHEARKQSVSWLKELGLEYLVEGLDIAELDASNQFLFFLTAAYLERTAQSIIRSLPDIQTFYVVTGQTPLPLDFYFDSDVPSAILRFVCERLGRNVCEIHVQDRQYVFPYFKQRPIGASIAAASAPPLHARHGKRAGFVPATVANTQQIADALSEMGWQTLLFESGWQSAALFLDSRVEIRSLHPEPALDASAAADLSALWQTVERRLPQSSLSPGITQNPRLRFQFQYIIEKRWRWYAAMVRAARRLVAHTTLDVFIHSDHFTAEGAILAHFYRRQGTPIIVAPHSAWPCDPNWSVRQSSDFGIAFRHSAAQRLQQTSRMRVFVTGPPHPVVYRSLVRSSETDAPVTTRHKSQGRKIIVVITNALELLCVPSTDLLPHFRTLSVLAQVPPALQDQVMLAIRAKPRPLGEDPIVYQALSGFTPENINLLDGLSFSECVRLADCVVSVNVPTTGFFEVMELGIPLLHIQTTRVLAMQPDLPPGVTAAVTADAEIWPAIAALLFDATKRASVLRTQREFVQNDRKSRISAVDRPLQLILDEVTGTKSVGFWRRWGRRPLKSKPGVAECPPLSESLEGKRIVHDGCAGFVDDLLLGSDGSMAVRGWAADLVARRPAKRVHCFSLRTWLATGLLIQQRPDVAVFFGDNSFLSTGFLIRIPPSVVPAPKEFSMYAELHDGSFGKLPGPQTTASQISIS